MEKTSNQELQKRLLEMMHWFHSFCVNNNLRYYALGGTMLGAARHQGFIPWDDDLDIGMPRKDYDTLSALLQNHPDDRYVLETPNFFASDYNYCFSKLYDTQTTLVEHLRRQIKRGIFIDIFPLDGMGNTEQESRNNFRKIDYRFKYLIAHTTEIREGRGVLKNAAVILSHTILNPFIDDKKMILDLNVRSAQLDFDACVYGGNPFGAWRYKEIMRRDIMGIPTLYKFEDMEIYGAEDCDAYLTHLYGDWRKLPPVEKRVSHHELIEIDLNKPYVECN